MECSWRDLGGCCTPPYPYWVRGGPSSGWGSLWNSETLYKRSTFRMWVSHMCKVSAIKDNFMLVQVPMVNSPIPKEMEQMEKYLLTVGLYCILYAWEPKPSCGVKVYPVHQHSCGIAFLTLEPQQRASNSVEFGVTGLKFLKGALTIQASFQVASPTVPTKSIHRLLG